MIEYPNFYAYKLSNESNELSEDEKKVFIEKISELYERPSQVIFRGESKSGLFNAYTTFDFTEFNHKLFCIGSKEIIFIPNRKL